MTREEYYERYSTMAIEPGEDDTWTVSDAEGEAVAYWVPSKQDALAISFGLKMYAECIKEEIQTEARIEWLTNAILEQSQKYREQMKDYDGPSH